MKKLLFIPALAAIAALSFVSCVDKNYDLNNSEADIKVDVQQDLKDVNAEDFFNVNSGKLQAGVITSPETGKANGSVSDADITKPANINFDQQTSIPMRELFKDDATEDMLKALDNPSVQLSLEINDCPDGNHIIYSGEINGVTFSVELPGNGKWVVNLSENGEVPVDGVIGSKVNNFSEIFKGMPESIVVDGIKAQAKEVKSGLRTTGSLPSFTMSAKAIFPLKFQQNKSFVINRVIDLPNFKDIDWQSDEYKNAKKIKINFTITHNFPVSLDKIKITDPKGVETSCSKIEAKSEPQKGQLVITFPNGLPKTIDKLGFEATVTGNGVALTNEMKVALTIDKVAVTTAL